jgi:hypothetical protein
MVPPAMERTQVEALSKSLLSFDATPEGREFLQKSQFESFLPPDEVAMARCDPYTAVLLQKK